MQHFLQIADEQDTSVNDFFWNIAILAINSSISRNLGKRRDISDIITQSLKTIQKSDLSSANDNMDE